MRSARFCASYDASCASRTEARLFACSSSDWEMAFDDESRAARAASSRAAFNCTSAAALCASRTASCGACAPACCDAATWSDRTRTRSA